MARIGVKLSEFGLTWFLAATSCRYFCIARLSCHPFASVWTERGASWHKSVNAYSFCGGLTRAGGVS